MQTANQLLRRSDFLAQSKTLLYSEEFSDVTVICQGRTWRLHQAIICPRSKFFRGAFQGEFKESTAKSLDLAEVDPRLFDYVVNYLYTGDCDWESLSQPDGNPFVQAARLCIVADYCALDQMILDICTYLREYYTPVARSIQRASRYMAAETQGPQPIDEVSKGFLKMYIEGAKVAFDHHTPSLDPLRGTFRQFVSDTAYCVLRDQAFTKALRECVALSQSILEHLFTEGSTFLDLIPDLNNMVPQMCSRCNQYNVYPYTATWVIRGQTQGRCKSCQERFEQSDP